MTIGGLEVRGGVGGVTARTEDMERAAAVLAAAGSAMAGVAARLAGVAADPLLLATGALSPASLGAAEVCLAAAVAGPSGVLTSGVRLDLMGLRLRAAALAYRAAEDGAQALVHDVDSCVGAVAGVLAVRMTPLAVPALPLAAFAAGPLRGELGHLPFGAMAGLVAAHAGLLEHVVDAVPGTVRQSAGLLLQVRRGSPLLRDTGAVVVTARPEQGVPPAGLADLVSGIAACYPETGAATPTVRVQGIRDANGRRAWVVEIPGTQDWSPVPGPDPFDLTADVSSMAGRPSAAERTVTEALRLAGARPDEPVLLAGHSLGGMLAAGLAADPAFRARFRVTHVVTAGSPIAEYPVPPGVGVLSLEHADDIVPALDGNPNPDRAGWVTVRQRLRPGVLTADPLLTHGVEGYRATAALVDTSNDPSLVAWRASLAPFLRRPGATAVDLVVTGHRPTTSRRGR
jgi:hypothetical protein